MKTSYFYNKDVKVVTRVMRVIENNNISERQCHDIYMLDGDEYVYECKTSDCTAKEAVEKVFN